MSKHVSEKSYNEGKENQAYEDVEMEEEEKEEEEEEEEDKKKSCCSGLKRTIKENIWTTFIRDDIEDKDLMAKKTLRELIAYCIFLSLICIITWDLTSAQKYQYTKQMIHLFTNTPSKDGQTDRFVDIKHSDDFLNYVQNILLPLLYDSEENKSIYLENKLQGVARLRQARVRKDACIPPNLFKNQHECYAKYSIFSSDTRPYGKGPGFNFSEEGSTVTTNISKYGTGGYHVDLNTTMATSIFVLNFLKENSWVDRSTRAIFIDFTVYNANINLFCVIKLIVEYPPTGGVFPSFDFRTVELIRYNNTSDMFVMACEFIFCLFLLYYIGEEFFEILKFGRKYLLDFWNIFDLIILFISVACQAFHLHCFLSITELIAVLSEQPHTYIDFDSISNKQLTFYSAFAFMVFLAWIKIFKYVKINATMSLLSKTLGTSAITIGEFSIMFFIIFLAFAQSGYLLFGSSVQNFSTFESSLLTLFRLILADFDIREFVNCQSILGPIFFVIFVFFIYFILTNMFIAILSDTYSTLKQNQITSTPEVDLKQFIVRAMKNFLMDEKLVKENQCIRLIEPINDDSHEDDVTFSVKKMESKLDDVLEKMISLENFIKTSKQFGV